jgi:phosphoglycolate phosphatase-like HAD superfamily hydrolase
VLWDVDGTLMNVDGVGIAAIAAGIQRVIGRQPAAFPMLHGGTDRWITTEVLLASGVENVEEYLEQCREATEAAFTASLDELARRGRLLPGAVAALAALRAESAVQSLLTGNARALAEMKLRAFGLAELVDFDIGAYGWAHVVRGELVAIARAAAEARHGTAFAGRATVLIGDTPRDVEAALVNGASAIAVATGYFGVDELAAAGAHVVLADLTDTAAVVDAVRTVVGGSAVGEL